MRLLAGIALCLVTACAASGFRNPDAPLSSMAVFDPVRFAGDWVKVAGYPSETNCLQESVHYSVVGPGALDTTTTCTDSGGRAASIGSARVIGPGRLRVSMKGAIAQDQWVLWVDESYRTAVIARPSGQGAWVLNRTPAISPDRLAAAFDVLRFNGFDVTQMQSLAQVPA